MAVVKRYVINKYGINAILEPIVDEILELEKDDGCQFTISGRKGHFMDPLHLYQVIIWACKNLEALKLYQEQIVSAENAWDWLMRSKEWQVETYGNLNC